MRRLFAISGVVLFLLAAMAFPAAAQATLVCRYNPVRGWAPSRVDEGVDGTLAHPFYAPLKVQIVFAQAYNPGWGSGGFVAGRVLNPPLKGAIVSVAEGVVPYWGRGVGTTVWAGQAMARRKVDPYNGIYGNVEVLFSNPYAYTQPLAQTFLGYSGNQSVQAITAGEAMNKLIGLCGGALGHKYSGNTANWFLLPTFMRNALGL